ncbi:MAG: DUF1844 domain-containing protein [Rubripirellula sp.]|nr:DUF1844 domain-containing protein [Rubripirellula sp.]
MSEAEKEEAGEEPKIVVDSDWKEQVAKEKEAAEVDNEPVENEAAENLVETDDAAPITETDEANSGALPPLPPASFEMLVSMLFTQAMAALGQVPNPASGESNVDKRYAKHCIDTLEMLGEKTKGNLSETESKMLDEALHALRMTYVNTKQP